MVRGEAREQAILAAVIELLGEDGYEAMTMDARRTSRPGGRVGAFGHRRGKSGLHRAGWWVTPTRGDPRDSATENRPPSGNRR